jgi:hypothetical protein
MLARKSDHWQGNMGALLKELQKQPYQSYLPGNARALRVYLGKAVDHLIPWGLRFDAWRDSQGSMVRIYWNKEGD